MRTWVVILAALALGALAGCVDPQTEASTSTSTAGRALADPVVVLEDPRGDAFERNWDLARQSVPCASVPSSPVPVATPCNPDAPAPVLESRGLAEAAPARDVVALALQETATTLEVRLDVAALDESLAGAVDLARGDGTIYVVALYEDERCLVAVWHFLWPMPDEVEQIAMLYWECDGNFKGPRADQDGAIGTPCGHSDCGWGVPSGISFGAPASVTWSVPRSMLAGSPLEEGIDGARAFTVRIAQPYGADVSKGETTLSGPVEMRWLAPDAAWYVFDASGPAAAFAMSSLPPVPKHASFPLRLTGDGIGRAERPTRPDLRLVDYVVDAPADRVRLAATLAAVDEAPRDHLLELGLTLPGHWVSAGYTVTGGERHAFANLYAPDYSSVGLPVTLDIVPGTPGTVVVELARADLPHIPPGSLASWIGAVTSESVRNGTELGAVALGTQHWRAMDFICCGPPATFAAAGAASAGPEVHRLTGATGDARLPADAVSTSRARFDLQTVEVASTVPGEIRFTIGVVDLSDLDPPDGYDAVFYAVGLEHAAGRTMVGYYRGLDRPLGQFLCATDTTVLADVPDDPVRSPDWAEVPGRVLVATEGADLNQGSRAAGSAAFVVGAPFSCFGLEPGAEELNVTQLAAGSYLIRRATQKLPETEPTHPVARVDTVPPAERPFTLALAQAVVAAPTFWQAPFGLENGWDILGAGLALFTVLATVAVFVRRRRLMRWYIDELARLDKMYLADAAARARALVSLRRRLHLDIVRHRVSDSEYIRDRLRSSLTSARLVTVSDGFYGLPAPLAMRLERMLDDGRMTAEESKLLEPLVEKARIPPQARDLLIERLRSWVEEDAATG